jgi:protein TonB
MKKILFLLTGISFCSVLVSQTVELKEKPVVTIEGEGLNVVVPNSTTIVEQKLPEAFDYVEEMPEYIGGRSEMTAFINKSMIYPKKELEGKISGSPIVKFVIDKNGKILMPMILGSSGNENIDKEAIRIVSIMPSWKPGKQNGNVVAVKFNLPIKFNPDYKK